MVVALLTTMVATSTIVLGACKSALAPPPWKTWQSQCLRDVITDCFVLFRYFVSVVPLNTHVSGEGVQFWQISILLLMFEVNCVSKAN